MCLDFGLVLPRVKSQIHSISTRQSQATKKPFNVQEIMYKITFNTIIPCTVHTYTLVIHEKYGFLCINISKYWSCVDLCLKNRLYKMFNLINLCVQVSLFVCLLPVFNIITYNTTMVVHSTQKNIELNAHLWPGFFNKILFIILSTFSTKSFFSMLSFCLILN